MSESEIKLRIIRLIASQKGDVLQELYQLILRKLYKENEQVGITTSLEEGYRAMSEDIEREKEAFEWVEGTLDVEEL